MRNGWTTKIGFSLIAMLLLVVPAMADDSKQQARAQSQGGPAMSSDMQAMLTPRVDSQAVTFDDGPQCGMAQGGQLFIDSAADLKCSAIPRGAMTSLLAERPQSSTGVKCVLGTHKAVAKVAGFDSGCPASGPTYMATGSGSWCSAWTQCPSTTELYCEGDVINFVSGCVATATSVSCGDTFYSC